MTLICFEFAIKSILCINTVCRHIEQHSEAEIEKKVDPDHGYCHSKSPLAQMCSMYIPTKATSRY